MTAIVQILIAAVAWLTLAPLFAAAVGRAIRMRDSRSVGAAGTPRTSGAQPIA